MDLRVSYPDPRTGIVLLELEGDLDLLTVPVLNEWLAGAPEMHVVVDLNSVAFMDSTGIGFLIRLWKQARGRGRRVVLCRLSPALVRIITVSGLAPWLDTFASAPEAVEALRAHPAPPSPLKVPVVPRPFVRRHPGRA